MPKNIKRLVTVIKTGAAVKNAINAITAGIIIAINAITMIKLEMVMVGTPWLMILNDMIHRLVQALNH